MHVKRLLEGALVPLSLHSSWTSNPLSHHHHLPAIPSSSIISHHNTHSHHKPHSNMPLSTVLPQDSRGYDERAAVIQALSVSRYLHIIVCTCICKSYLTPIPHQLVLPPTTKTHTHHSIEANCHACSVFCVPLVQIHCGKSRGSAGRQSLQRPM